MTTIDKAALDALRRPSDTACYDERCWETHAPVASVHRDSDAFDRANWKTWNSELAEWTEGDDPDVFREAEFGHWAVGWVKHLFVRVYVKDFGHSGVYTPAFQRAFELLEELENYPVLDGDALQEEEHEDLVSDLKNYLDIPEERVEEAIQWLWNEHEVSYFEETTDEIIEELKALFVPDVTTD